MTGLSRFSYLKVIARSSTSRCANESVDVRSAGEELGARYVMAGNQAGAKLRLAVEVVDASSDAHLWAENYEFTFSPRDGFRITRWPPARRAIRLGEALDVERFLLLSDVTL